METQKFIKKAVVATMLFSTLILPSVQTTTALADTFNPTAINDMQIKNNVSAITVNFLDPNGNKIGQITKDHVLIGKNFKTVNKYMYDNWKILNAEQTGVLKEGGTSLDITLKPNKTHKLTIQYVFENGQIVQTESLELPHGSKILINPKNAEGYELVSDSKELVVSSDDYVQFIYKSTTENQENFNVDKAEVINKGFGLSYIELENGASYFEEDSLVDIVPEDYNYQYTDTFNDINNNPILRNISYSRALDMNELNTADAYNHLYYYAKAKDLMTFDEYFGSDVTGITPNKKVVDLNEILEVHGLNPDEVLKDAHFQNVTLVNGEQTIDGFSRIEDAKYLLGLVHAPISNVENLGDYLDYEFDNVHHDIVVTYDVPLSIQEYFPDMLLEQYPRIGAEIAKNLEGKRVPLYDGGKFSGSFNQNLSAFGDIYKKDGQFRIKVYMVDRPLNSGSNYNLDYIGGLKIDLNSQITVNYVDEKGVILDTTTETIAKDTNYNVSNKTFDGYELKDINDKDKVVFVNKDMVVNIEYKPLATTPQVDKGKIITKYVDENGKDLAEPKEFVDVVGKDFTVNAIDLEGYELVSKGEVTGKVTKEDTIINFVYKKIETPVEPEKPVEPEVPVEPTEPEKPVEAPEEPLYQTNANKPNKNIVIANLVVFTTAILGTAVSILKKGKKG